MGKKKPRGHRYAAKWDAYFSDSGLEGWQKLCADLGMRPDIPSKTQCRKAMAGVWINICDFLDAKDKLKVHHFDSEVELSNYTVEKRRTFPMWKLKENPDSPLKLLMANILSPRRRGKKSSKSKPNNKSNGQARVGAITHTRVETDSGAVVVAQNVQGEGLKASHAKAEFSHGAQLSSEDFLNLDKILEGLTVEY